ncbi:hypothetical protein PROFUN_11828 [Planoprotostelium fungivorum]|uniref:4-vinyl reductase 4VR domain-containing protein n=1 Tax=Planoprotostelium fungivorum TaxID=1890364 RepID=A0A2P6N989_9EUKA|nr:hypothetical protein PROFUN_11828 [Planoprotostelium fungivorum]
MLSPSTLTTTRRKHHAAGVSEITFNKENKKSIIQDIASFYRLPGQLISRIAEEIDTRGLMDLSDIAHAIGHTAVSRIVHRRKFMRMSDALEFIAADFWIEVFHKKEVNIYSTTMPGTFLIFDHRWRGEDESSSSVEKDRISFPCHMIRGALCFLGVKASVEARIINNGSDDHCVFIISEL